MAAQGARFIRSSRSWKRGRRGWGPYFTLSFRYPARHVSHGQNGSFVTKGFLAWPCDLASGRVNGFWGRR